MNDLAPVPGLGRMLPSGPSGRQAHFAHSLWQAFVDLVEAPAGTRPFRSTVGLDLDIAKINALTDPFRLRALAQMGVDSLDKIPPR